MSTQIDNADNTITFTAYCGAMRVPGVDMHFKGESALKELRDAYNALWINAPHTTALDDLIRWQNIVLELDRRIKTK